MAKIEKIFTGDSCPNCDAALIVNTTCREENDTEFEQYYYDGDDVRCEANCGFISTISINEDESCAYIADGNLDELEECFHCGSSNLDKDEHFCNNCSEYYDD